MLMDGELCDDEAEVLLGKIKRHPEAQHEWLTYHLISDALRQPDCIPGNLSTVFLERLHAEPTVLAPHTKPGTKSGYFAMSAVASIMAMAFLAWLSVHIDTNPAIRQAQQNPNALRAASLPANTNLTASDSMNDYLLAHQEYSPGTDVRGASSYLRTVAFNQPMVSK